MRFLKIPAHKKVKCDEHEFVEITYPYSIAYSLRNHRMQHIYNPRFNTVDVCQKVPTICSKEKFTYKVCIHCHEHKRID